MEDLTDVYNDLIMEHSMNSYNKKKLPEADFCEIGHNPNCGDEISIEAKTKWRYNRRYGIYRTWMCNITSFNIHNDRYVKR